MSDTRSNFSSPHTMELGVPLNQEKIMSVTVDGDACADPLVGENGTHMEVDPLYVEEDNTPRASDSCLSSVLNCLGNIMPAGGLLATGFSMASTVIGAGVLGLPSAFADVGYIMGTIYLFLITAETVYSMRIIVQVAEKTGLGSFEEMATYLLHPRGLYAVALIRCIHTLGAQIAYVVTIGDLIRPVLVEANAPSFLTGDWGIRLLTTIIWFVMFLPVAIPREVNALRYVSTVGLAFIVFFCFCIMIHSGMAKDRPALQAVATGNNAIGGVGVFIFSYMCQVNVLECTREMHNCTIKRFTATATVSMSICGMLYFLTGLFGYLEYGTNVSSSILSMFDPLGQPQFLISYIGILIKICASYGLLSHACRSAAYAAIGWNPRTVAFWKHATFAVCLATVSLIGGLFIPKVTMVFGFVGGFCGGFIAFIFPALFYMFSGNWTIRSVGVVNYVSTMLTLIAGVVALVFGTASTIYEAFPNN